MLERSLSAIVDGPLTEAAVVDAVNELVSLRGRVEESVRPDTRLEELGLDSLDHAQLLVVLEEIAGCELDAEPAAAFTVVGELASLRPAERP